MTRNFGVDIAKIVAMFMVVLIHNLLAGGLLHYDSLSNLQYIVIWGLENFGICAVNLFALTTGYLMINREIKYIRIWHIIIECSFWALLCAIFIIGIGYKPSFLQLVSCILPLPAGQYWYINAYIGVMLVAPFINMAFAKMDKIRVQAVVITMTLMAGTMGFVGSWALKEGYSTMWLLILYCIGGYIKVYANNGITKTKLLMVIITAMMLVSLMLEFIFRDMSDFFIRYTSPFVIVQSISLFCLCLRLRVTNEKSKKIIAFLSPLTLGVYLIDNSMFFNYLNNKFVWMTNQNALIMLFEIILISAIMFAFFLMCEYVRIIVFRRFKVYSILDDMYLWSKKQVIKNVMRVKQEW